MSFLSETPPPLTPSTRGLVKARRTAKFAGPRGTIFSFLPDSIMDLPASTNIS